MDFDGGAVQRHRFDLDADDLMVLHLREYPIQHAALRPAIHAGVDRVPVAEALGKTAPFAALFGHLQNRVQHSQIGQAHVATLRRQTVLDQAVLRVGDFHPRSISQKMIISVNTP